MLPLGCGKSMPRAANGDAVEADSSQKIEVPRDSQCIKNPGYVVTMVTSL